MGYKKWNQNVSFSDIDLSSSLEKNRSLKTMERINRIIDWTKVASGPWGPTPQPLAPLPARRRTNRRVKPTARRERRAVKGLL
jgi:hypothetical protein